MIYGPTYAEMLDPARLPEGIRAAAQAARKQPLDPMNLYNITWKDARGEVEHVVLPRALTGIDCPIAVISGRRFPSGSHKVGAVYTILVEKQLDGAVNPLEHTIVLPSTGNYGIGGAWVGPRMGYQSLVVLPEEMSRERFEKIRGYGADVIATPGCESNVKEIFDEVRRLRAVPTNRILEQFSEMGNYRFHYEVTGNSVADLAGMLAGRGIGSGRVSAFVSAMGSAGTIAAGDRLKQLFGTAIVGLEPVQCPTLYNVGFGGHRIEGIGDKHVTWIHNVMNMDWLCCIDDLDCVHGLQLIQEGADVLAAEGVPDAEKLQGLFGVSGICNILGAVKTAKLLGLGADDLIVTVATDSFDRYPSVIERIGKMARDEALRRLATVFRGCKTDYVLEGTRETRRRWHNQKYFTWVEQQGKTIRELDALASPDFWMAEQARIAEIDHRLAKASGRLEPAVR